MQIRLDFAEPLHISTLELDKVVVFFDQTNLLFDEQGLSLPQESSVYHKLPPQFAKLEVGYFSKLDSTFGTIETEGDIVSKTLLNAIQAATWQHLLAPIASHQVIMFMPLFNVVYPANAQFYCRLLLEVASYDAIPSEEINGGIWQKSLENGDDIGKFESLGYDGPFIVANLTSTLIMLSLAVLSNIVLFALTFMTCKFRDKLKSCRPSIRGNLFWRLPNGFLIESYSVLTICCVLNLKNLKWDHSAVSFN